MTANTAPQRNCKTVSELRLAAVSFAGKLDEGELLTGTPTVLEVSTSDLTLANKIVNTGEVQVNMKAVPIGQAVQFSIADGVAGEDYIINISVGTDATPPQTLITNVLLTVTSDS